MDSLIEGRKQHQVAAEHSELSSMSKLALKSFRLAAQSGSPRHSNERPSVHAKPRRPQVSRSNFGEKIDVVLSGLDSLIDDP